MGASVISMTYICFVGKTGDIFAGASLVVSLGEKPICEFEGFSNLYERFFESAAIINDNY